MQYSKHFHSESLASREKRWQEPDKSRAPDVLKVVLHYVVSPRITIEDLEVKEAIPSLSLRNYLILAIMLGRVASFSATCLSFKLFI